ncbi:hypothetical protein RHGRI_009380 [Rhododendron griersonianum]|uniref:Uncharacterized protein n=1 Tax=Rhododendron griersonianum TaxID=479676 RepID=A0AAV6KEI1_9ERIC|nr:hypothetical protein RHGRI_009380 [Rhododendron griersonianum]
MALLIIPQLTPSWTPRVLLLPIVFGSGFGGYLVPTVFNTSSGWLVVRDQHYIFVTIFSFVTSQLRPIMICAPS